MPEIKELLDELDKIEQEAPSIGDGFQAREPKAIAQDLRRSITQCDYPSLVQAMGNIGIQRGRRWAGDPNLKSEAIEEVLYKLSGVAFSIAYGLPQFCACRYPQKPHQS